MHDHEIWNIIYYVDLYILQDRKEFLQSLYHGEIG